MTTTLLAVHTASIITMCIVILEFRHIARKRYEMIDAFGGKAESIRHSKLPMYLYVLATAGIAAVTLYLFVWQPGIL